MVADFILEKYRVVLEAMPSIAKRLMPVKIQPGFGRKSMTVAANLARHDKFPLDLGHKSM